MEKKSLIGIKLLKVFFILSGLYLLGNSYFLFTVESSYPQLITLQFTSVDNAAKEMLKKLEVFKKDEYQMKLKESGRLEEFNKAQENFKHSVAVYLQEYKPYQSKGDKLMMVVSLFAGVIGLIAGFTLTSHFNWARYLSLVNLAFFCFLYFLFWNVILYPILHLTQYMIDNGNALNLLVDPQYTDLSKYAGKSTVAQMLFQPPYVLYHICFFLMIGWAVFYLTNSRIKEQFK